MPEGLPYTWKTKMLGTICQLSGGYGFPDSFQGSVEGELPFIKVSDMSLLGNERDIVNANNYVSMRIANSMGWKPFPAGAVVFAKVGAALKLNRRRILIKPTLIDNNMMAAIPQGGFDSAFLYHFLCVIDFGDFVQDGALPSVNQEQVGSIKLPDINKDEQRRIAEILDTIDETIQKTETLISKLKAMKQGLLHDLLTRGLDKNGKLRDPKAHPEQFKDSPLGRIPKEWGVFHFESIVLSTTLGTTVRGTNVKEECVPLLKMGNLDWGEIVFEKLEYVQKGLIPSSENVTLQFRDLLFNTRNTPELVGKTAVWRDELPNAVHDNNLLRVRFKQGIASPFVCYYMSTGQGKDRVHALSTGTTSVAAIYWNNLRKYLLPIPPENEQERMVSIVDTHDARIRTEEQYRDKLKLQKKGLMHDLLTGKVRVQI